MSISFYEANEGGEGEHQGITGKHEAAFCGGTSRQPAPWLRAVHGEKETEGEESKTKMEKMRERGIGVWILIPSSGRRRRRGSPREIDNGRRATVLLHCAEEDNRERSWAGPRWAVICCTQAAEKRERRKDLGRIRLGEKERRKGTLFLFVFSFCFLFSKLLHYFEFTQGLKPSLEIIKVFMGPL
jgi:hypothetical protein